jgi:hypothetical protein
MKKTKQQLINEWAEMTDEEKAVWNGFKGYCQGKTYYQDSLFIPRKRIYRVIPN